MTKQIQLTPAVLTGETCAALLSRLARALSCAEIDLKTAPLWHDLEAVRWLATLKGPVTSTFGPALFHDQKVANGVRDATMLQRTVVALEVASKIPRFAAEMRPLANWRLYPAHGDRLGQEAWDHVFQAEIAARLLHRFPNLRFDEPDLRVCDEETGLVFSLACKRPTSKQSIVNAATRAMVQVRKHAALGVPVICLDNAIDRIAVDSGDRSLSSTCDERLNDLMTPLRPRIERALTRFWPRVESEDDAVDASGILGFLGTASFLLSGRLWPGGPGYVNTGLRTWRCWLSDHPVVQDGLSFVSRTLIEGEQRLKDLQ